MKLFILALFVLASCSSHQPKPRAKYDQDLVCSLAALEYLKPKGKISKTTSTPTPDSNLIRMEILKISPHVKRCYEVELKNPAISFSELNLCYVVGTNKNGNIEFSNFYSNEEHLSKDFLKCLNDKKQQPNLAQFKSVKISQPFRLIPASK
jgi:hypothetical protein